MSRITLLPIEQQKQIVRTLYTEADTAGWLTLTPAEKTEAYARWVADARVGGVLTRYMTTEAARSWLKDGPMKEYSNARRGLGRYAQLGRHGGTNADDIANAALGGGAKVLDGTTGVKPMHCTAVDATGVEAYLNWGEAKNFRNLLWTALRASVSNQVPAHVVILEPPGHTTPTSEVTTQRAIASRCDVNLHHLAEVLGEVAGDDRNP